MKRFLILLTSIALLCSLLGCTSSVNKETTVPLETVPATEASASGQKLQLAVEPTGEIGFTRVPAEQLGKEKVDLAYARLSGVNITLDGCNSYRQDHRGGNLCLCPHGCGKRLLRGKLFL